MKPLANRVPCFYQKLFMIKQAKKLNERLWISATKNKNTVLHVYIPPSLQNPKVLVRDNAKAV